jgi:rfaE bifunctional protein nucleotidyltransferase chain/domain
MGSIQKIVDWEDVVDRLKEWRDNKEKIVFTNGCFDVLHLGHIDYLEKARSLGNRLIVGLNSDSSVTKLKGTGRPIYDQDARARILAALEFVDIVIMFDQETPYDLIDHVKPDILVKGNDYLAENIVGADIVKSKGGEVMTINLVKGYSTSSLIEKINQLNN